MAAEGRSESATAAGKCNDTSDGTNGQNDGGGLTVVATAVAVAETPIPAATISERSSSMHVLVGAAAEHSYPVVITVPTKAAPGLLAAISGALDDSGLARGEHWSLDAGVLGSDVRLRFACSSQALAELVELILHAHMAKATGAASPHRDDWRFHAGGKMSGRFIGIIRFPAGSGNDPRAAEAAVGSGLAHHA